MINLKKIISAFAAGSLVLLSTQAHALQDQWFVGIGGSGAWLQPNPEEPGLGIKNRQGVGGNVFFGLDFDDRSSGQITLYSLGEAELKNKELVPYAAADISVLYRFYDSKDARIRRGGMSVALYGRFALGYLNRDTKTRLTDDAAVYFGAGGGLEWFITHNFSMRMEGLYHSNDVASGSIQLVARFGGAPRLRRPTRPSPITTDSELSTGTAQSTAPIVDKPVTTVQIADLDGDKIPDSQDRCPGSTVGFPVRATGCALFDGVLSGVSFFKGSEELMPGSFVQLDYLASVMKQFPKARVELHAHTDNTGSVRDQAVLTRKRLRTMGVYLVGKGVSANRLVLRSFGGTRPLYENGTERGRTGNNRIEVLENKPQ